MTRYFYFAYLLLAVVLTGCGDDQKNKGQVEEQPQSDYDQRVEIINKNEVKLSSEAIDKLNNWQEFMNVKTEIDNFTEMDLQGVINNSATLNKAVKRMNDSIPEQFDNAAVRGRVKVLSTKTHILAQKIRNRNYSKESINNSAVGIYEALMNLEIQFNEIYLKPIEDIEAEMEKAVKDSTAEEESEQSS